MAAAIVATVGGANSNSYATVAEAVAYFEARLNASAWDGADADKRVRSLIMATNRIDQEVYSGSPSSSTQALKFPRVGAYDGDGRPVDSSAIPAGIKEAQFELALTVLSNDLFADTGLEQFESVKVGPLEVTPRVSRKAGALPAHVARELAPFLETPPGSVRLMRG